MHLKLQQIVLFITIVLLASCRERPLELAAIQGTQIEITDSLGELDSISNFIDPYRKHVNKVLDSTLAYAPYTISKNDGELNSTAGNLLADLLYIKTNPIYQSRTGNQIDFVLLNHGGIRNVISKGPVSARTAYEIMPFDNIIVVVEMKGRAVRDLVQFLIRSGRAHPLSGIEITLTQESALQSVNINGKPFDENRTYHVGTVNYLVEGGDDMGFFKEGQSVTSMNYLLRNAIIDYFRDVDTLKPKVDNRFIRLDR